MAAIYLCYERAILLTQKGGDREKMASKKKYSKMVCQISEREDNLYHPKIISNILKMYMEECKAALLRGERVQLTGIGTIIPEVKVHENDVRVCERNCVNMPYTRMRMTRNYSLVQEMNCKLQKNIENGVLGLEELPFSKQQIAILRNSGMIPDEESQNGEE